MGDGYWRPTLEWTDMMTGKNRLDVAPPPKPAPAVVYKHDPIIIPGQDNPLITPNQGSTNNNSSSINDLLNQPKNTKNLFVNGEVNPNYEFNPDYKMNFNAQEPQSQPQPEPTRTYPSEDWIKKNRPDVFEGMTEMRSRGYDPYNADDRQKYYREEGV